MRSSVDKSFPESFDILSTDLFGFIEEHLPECGVVDLHPGNGGRRALHSLADHDGVSGSHVGLVASDVEGNGVHEGVRIHVVVVDGALVPYLVNRLVVNVGKMTARQRER